MKKLLALATLALATTSVYAKDKQYEDGIFVSGNIQNTGTVSCRNNDTSSVCSNDQRAYYVVLFRNHQLTLTPQPTKGQIWSALATEGLTAALARRSVLYYLEPNTPILIRTDNKHYWVRAENHESQYRALSNSLANSR